jgi:hypothetical protein
MFESFSAQLQIRLLTYRNDELESKVTCDTSLDGSLEDVIEKIRGFLLAAGYSYELIAEHLPDAESILDLSYIGDTEK